MTFKLKLLIIIISLFTHKNNVTFGYVKNVRHILKLFAL